AATLQFVCRHGGRRGSRYAVLDVVLRDRDGLRGIVDLEHAGAREIAQLDTGGRQLDLMLLKWRDAARCDGDGLVDTVVKHDLMTEFRGQPAANHPPGDDLDRVRVDRRAVVGVPQTAEDEGGFEDR